MKTSDFLAKYQAEFQQAINHIESTDASGKVIPFAEAVDQCVALLKKIQQEERRAYIVGNGGSAGIAGHTAIDLWKNGGVPTQAFNDASLLTCLSNDIGFDKVFSLPIEMFARKGDLVICISSSGNSQNILNAAQSALDKGCDVITLSGFDKGNKLKPMGHINFFVPAFSYGFAEVIHQYILHAILDTKLYCSDGRDVYNKNLPM
jgi:D-sedoheptulose 7-phosphate isomerase